MKKNLLFLLFALMCGLNANAQTIIKTISKDAAVALATQKVGQGDYDYYIGETTTFPTDNPSFGSVGTPSRQETYWFVFVDLKPNAGWEHPCKYVYVKKKYSVTDTDYIIVKDAVCPPANVNLTPYKKVNRYGTKSRMKPNVPKIQSNTPNVAAGHTYAVIVNGGMTATANNERYWNDCSFMYKTLRNRYGIPKQNIKVLMSDGTSDGKDMLLTDGGFASSPLDLDDDGSPDIEYAATKANLSAVLGGLAQKLTDDDHLFLFFMDHGGYDNVSKRSYIYMWNYEMMYPSELASYLNPINAGYISMLFGQCNAGGFIEPLKATNRIITTACKDTELSYACEEIPFDEFVYHWTSAINGYDAYGNAVTYNADGSVTDDDRSLQKAAEYAYSKDHYVNGSMYAQETPLINYLTNTNITDLRFDNIPPVIDLYFEYTKNNIVSELKTQEPKTYNFQIERILKNSHYRENQFWDCPNVWIKNRNSENTQMEPEMPRVYDHEVRVDIYAKVRNRGVKQYTSAKSEKITGFWTKSSLLITKDMWLGVFNGGEYEDLMGSTIASSTIINPIAPGQSVIVKIKNTVDNNLDTLEDGTAFPMCVLLHISNKNADYNLPTDTLGIVAVWGTDKVAQTNTYVGRTAEDMGTVGFYNGGFTSKKYTIKINTKDNTNTAFKDADVSLKMSPSLMAAWKKGGHLGINIEEDKNVADRVCLKDSGCVLRNIMLEPRQYEKIKLNCSYLAQNAITSDKRADIDVVVIDESTGRILGGETFIITQEARPAINPQVETALQSGKVVLTATNVSESAKYYWYDASGKLVGTGSTFNVPAGQQASNYTVRVEATSDGAISYSQATMVHESSIRNVNSTPKEINVTFESPVSSNATLRLASSTGNMPASDYGVESGTTTYSIPAANMPAGVYQVTLIEDGTVTGTKKFTK